MDKKYFEMTRDELVDLATSIVESVEEDSDTKKEALEFPAWDDEASPLSCATIAATLHNIHHEITGGDDGPASLVLMLLLGNYVGYLADACKLCYVIGWRAAKQHYTFGGIDDEVR